MASHSKKAHSKEPIYFCECGRNFGEKKGMTKHQNTCSVFAARKVKPWINNLDIWKKFNLFLYLFNIKPYTISIPQSNTIFMLFFI